MKDRPILFSAPMIRALLDGRKTQTRRIAKFEPLEKGYNLNFSGLRVGHYCTGAPASGFVLSSRGAGGCWNDRTRPLHCPYGVPGDLLWVRENGELLREAYDHVPEPAPGHDLYRDAGWRHATDGALVQRQWRTPPLSEWVGDCTSSKRPSIHMPRWASRLTLRITDVRVQRLQEISSVDCIAEGIEPAHTGDAREEAAFNRTAYFALWDSINGEGSSDRNEWVWALTFEVIKANVDQVLKETAP